MAVSPRRLAKEHARFPAIFAVTKKGNRRAVCFKVHAKFEALNLSYNFALKVFLKTAELGLKRRQTKRLQTTDF
jgi:hypothetical protein